MSDAPVSLPASLTELKIEIGKNIMRAGLSEVYDDPVNDRRIGIEELVAMSPVEYHADAGDRWRLVYPEATKQIEIIAERAIPCCTDRDGLVVSLMSDLSAACEQLDRQQRTMLIFHIGAFFQSIINVGPTPEAKQCLEVLAAYGRGE